MFSKDGIGTDPDNFSCEPSAAYSSVFKRSTDFSGGDIELQNVCQEIMYVNRARPLQKLSETNNISNRMEQFEEEGQLKECLTTAPVVTFPTGMDVLLRYGCKWI